DETDNTFDGGATWTYHPLIPDTFLQQSPIVMYGVACPSVATCYAVGTAGSVFVTHDTGNTWTLQLSNTSPNLARITCPLVTVCYAVGSGDTIIGTTDGGNTWLPQTVDLPSASFNSISCLDISTCFAAGNVVVATSDGGRTWTGQPSVAN